MARILLGNDNVDLLDLCQSILEEAGHLVESLTNGTQVLEVARTWHPDLVVLDWVMPEVDGIAAVKALRADPSTASLPIVMMSASPAADTRARDAGADAFLRKPFDSGDLVSCVARLLEARGRGGGPRLV